MMQPSTRKILLADYGAFLLAIAAPVAWGLYGAAKLFGGLPTRGGETATFAKSGPFLLGMAVVATVICVPLLLRRLLSYHDLLTTGRDVQATITSVWFEKDRGRVEYTYEYEGQGITGGNAIMKNKDTKALQAGGRVWLAIDPDNPKRAVIRHLYCVSS